MLEDRIHGLEEFHQFPWERIATPPKDWNWKIALDGGGQRLKGEWHIDFLNIRQAQLRHDCLDIWIVPAGVAHLIEFCREEGVIEAQRAMRQSIGIEE